MRLLPQAALLSFSANAFRSKSFAAHLAVTAALVAAIAQSACASPQFTDANWISLGGYPGIGGQVMVVATDSGRGAIYYGGQFTIAGTMFVTNLAGWDGTNWFPLGAGISGGVNALTIDPAGNLYAGGSITAAGGIAVSNIARWNGAGWSNLGPGVNGTVYAALADNSGNIFVGGSFSLAGGASAQNIAKWDGSTWSALGQGTSGAILALALDQSGNLYAGGSFTNAGGVAVSSVAKWDGTNWFALGAGVSDGTYSPHVTSLAFDSSGNLYVGGSFSFAGSNSAVCIAKWDGSNWTALGSGLNGTVQGLVAGPAGAMYAGGIFNQTGSLMTGGIAKWDGANWSALGTGANLVNTLAFDRSGNLFIGGSFNSAGGTPVNAVARWDGSAWSALGANKSGLSGAQAWVYALANDSSGNLFAGGTFTLAAGSHVNRIAKWNGTNWSPVGSGIGGFGSSEYYANAHLASDGRGNVYGLASLNTNNSAATNVVRWDGTNWSVLSTNPAGGPFFAPPQPPYPGYPVLPLAITTDRAGAVVVGGYFSSVDGAPAQNIARWNGTNWNALGSGCEGPISALAADPLGNIYAAGGFTYAGNVLASNIAKWDGANWSALGSGIEIPYYDEFPNEIKAIAADGFGNVYAGGTFSYAGNTNVNHIAKWDGTNWSGLGAGINGTVTALVVDSVGNLYVGGGFVIGGGINATNIARWDGTNWYALGSGVSGSVETLSYDGNGHLYVGGNLSKAGTNVSLNVAEAIVGIATNPPTLTLSNIASGGIGLSWPLDHTGWRLQSQRNPPGVGITSNWFTIPGSTNVNSTNFVIRTGVGSVFYRLVYP